MRRQLSQDKKPESTQLLTYHTGEDILPVTRERARIGRVRRLRWSLETGMIGSSDGRREITLGKQPGAEEVFSAWIPQLGTTIESGDADGFTELFLPEGYWRDILSFTWKRPTFSGHTEIREAFIESVPMTDATNFRVAARRSKARFARRSGRQVLEAWFDFDTSVGSGAGFVRLSYTPGDGASPKIWLLLTTLQSIRGCERTTDGSRPTGEAYSRIGSSMSWKQHREQEKAFLNRDPAVLIIGAGHSGLMLAARLGQMGVDTLVVEKNARVGDNWRHP